MPLTGRAAVFSWALQIVTGVTLAQTLYFKFTGAPESVHIFRTLGMEPAGRIGSGVAELIAVVLLLMPQTAVYGALLSLAVITGAIMSHLTRLGIVVQGDGGLLFGLALCVFFCSLGVVALRRGQLPIVGRLLPRAASGAAPTPEHPQGQPGAIT